MKKILIALALGLLTAGCTTPSTDQTLPAENSTPQNISNPTPMPQSLDGIQIEILKEGKGAPVSKGANLSMHYVGTLTDGSKFDSSRDRGQPFHFTLGGGQVIAGWDEGIVGMKVGEVRKLTISPEKGYGSMNMGPIPANSTLIFEVELMEVK
jgi:FKBP-type peptidyl-prolyl cis-trans isomerase